MLGCTALGGMCVRETVSVTPPHLIRAQWRTVRGADNKGAQIRFLAALRFRRTGSDRCAPMLFLLFVLLRIVRRATLNPTNQTHLATWGGPRTGKAKGECALGLGELPNRCGK